MRNEEEVIGLAREIAYTNMEKQSSGVLLETYRKTIIEDLQSIGDNPQKILMEAPMTIKIKRPWWYHIKQFINRIINSTKWN